MKIKDWWRYVWWSIKTKREKMVFKQKGFVVVLKKIPRPLPSRFAYLVINPWIIKGSVNWIITEKEINEKSSHPLAQDLIKIPNLLAFSIVEDSLMFDIAPCQTSQTIIAIVDLIFEWTQLQKKTELLFV